MHDKILTVYLLSLFYTLFIHVILQFINNGLDQV